MNSSESKSAQVDRPGEGQQQHSDGTIGEREESSDSAGECFSLLGGMLVVEPQKGRIHSPAADDFQDGFKYQQESQRAILAR